MIIYSKIINGKAVLYGTLGNVASEDDVALTYKNGTEEITLAEHDIYLDGKSANIVRKSDGKFVDCYIGNTKVIPAK